MYQETLSTWSNNMQFWLWYMSDKTFSVAVEISLCSNQSVCIQTTCISGKHMAAKFCSLLEKQTLAMNRTVRCNGIYSRNVVKTNCHIDNMSEYNFDIISNLQHSARYCGWEASTTVTYETNNNKTFSFVIFHVRLLNTKVDPHQPFSAVRQKSRETTCKKN